MSQQIFGGMTIGSYLKSILCQFQTHSKYDEIKKYFDSHPIKEAERSIQQGNAFSRGACLCRKVCEGDVCHVSDYVACFMRNN